MRQGKWCFSTSQTWRPPYVKCYLATGTRLIVSGIWMDICPLWSTLSLLPPSFQSKYDSHCDPNPIFQLKKYVVPTFSFFLWYLSRHILADPLVRVGHVLSFLTHQSDPSVKENFRHGVKGDLTRPVEKTIWETRLKSFKKRWRQKNGALCNLSAEDWQLVPHQPILKEIVSNNTQVTIKIVP